MFVSIPNPASTGGDLKIGGDMAVGGDLTQNADAADGEVGTMQHVFGLNGDICGLKRVIVDDMLNKNPTKLINIWYTCTYVLNRVDMPSKT